MTDTPSASGADLARQALARARAAAKTAPTTGPKRRTPRRARREMGAGRDPRPLGSIVDRLAEAEGWTDSLGAGNILDRWPDLCPTVYANTTRPVGYDPHTGTLTVQTDSYTVAAGLRLAQISLAKTINDKLGRTVVRQIRVRIGADGASAPELGEQIPAPRPPAEAPVRTRADGCPGYQDALAAALEHKPTRPPANPYVEEAMRRQEAALRAGRQAEDEHRDAVWAQDTGTPTTGSVEESLARARAVARQQRAGHMPRRVFDVA